MTAQAIEAKRQADFIALQSDILKQERLASEHEAAYESTVKSLASVLRRYHHAWTVLAGDTNVHFKNSLDEASWADELLIPRTTQLLRNHARWMWDPEPLNGQLSLKYPFDFNRIHVAVTTAERAIKLAEGHNTPRTSALELAELATSVDRMASILR